MLVLLISKYLLGHKDNPVIKTVMSVLKLTVIGLIAAAAALLVNAETFGTYAENPLQFFLSIGLFAAAFIASLTWKVRPILQLVIAGVVGGIVYYVFM